MIRTNPEFRSDVDVHLLDHMGDENSIVRRARVSTGGPGSSEKNNPGDELTGADIGLIRMLYRDKHGVPFEGVEFEFYFRVPIFVSRQIVKHRMSGINEESGRYRELQGEFYVVPDDRKIEQIGKTGSYQFKESDASLVTKLQEMQVKESTEAWTAYQDKIEMGVAKEVARQTLPLNIYSSMYYKTNLRSALNFLSLRKEWGDESLYPSHPQYEITLVADKMAEAIKEVVPNVYDEFIRSGMRPV